MSRPTAALILDDSEIDRTVIGRLLRDEGFSVYYAHDTGVALWILQNRAIGVLITDEVMPGQLGHEFVTELRDNPAFCNLPVVFVSGTAVSPSRILRMVATGGPIRFLPKPVTRVQLLEQVRGVLSDAEDVA